MIQERTKGLETKESIRMKISELTPHVEETVMRKGNHSSPFDSSSEGMGSLWTLPVDVRMVIIDGIVKQKFFGSVWSELFARKLFKVNDFNTIEQIYNKMNITVWKTIWQVAGVYESLLMVQPKNEDRVDKQKEQLMDFIFIQAARILSKRSKNKD